MLEPVFHRFNECGDVGFTGRTVPCLFLPWRWWGEPWWVAPQLIYPGSSVWALASTYLPAMLGGVLVGEVAFLEVVLAPSWRIATGYGYHQWRCS